VVSQLARRGLCLWVGTAAMAVAWAESRGGIGAAEGGLTTGTGESVHCRDSSIRWRAGQQQGEDLRIGITETGRIGCGAPKPTRWFRVADVHPSRVGMDGDVRWG